MLTAIKITNEDVLAQVKLSYKMPDMIDQIATRKVIENAALEMGIEVEIEELQQAADKTRLSNQLNSADDTLKWLEKHNLSLDDFEYIVHHYCLTSKLAQYLFAAKVEPYFFENQLDYSGAVVYEMVLDDEDIALELFYAIKEGEVSFYDVAHEHIQDIELRRKCGYRGRVNRKNLGPEVSAAIFAAKPPQLLKPIITSKGVHLVLVEEIIQPELDEKLRYQIMSDLFAEWVEQQVEKVEISTVENDVKQTALT